MVIVIIVGISIPIIVAGTIIVVIVVGIVVLIVHIVTFIIVIVDGIIIILAVISRTQIGPRLAILVGRSSVPTSFAIFFRASDFVSLIALLVGVDLLASTRITRVPRRPWHNITRSKIKSLMIATNVAGFLGTR